LNEAASISTGYGYSSSLLLSTTLGANNRWRIESAKADRAANAENSCAWMLLPDVGLQIVSRQRGWFQACDGNKLS
jgi:hypothetical protein